ncbi:fatty acid--CoA ligase [Spongiibacter marinus]|uniref:fatty acid--CoA ligase n=1 Tax=Spongiibacter marinus TaxID=354246 RepID=UPI00041E47EF|nr:fatty acid--CoA ligase [Spongiibacter marinus]
MNVDYIGRASEAYSYPLLIKQLWNSTLVHSPDQEVVYGEDIRFTYVEVRRRVGRLASALASLGVVPGDTVAVMDWDSHRYFECYSAVPMMGSVLQTVNIRMSPEQILYTLDHSKPKVLVINSDFLDIYDEISAKLDFVDKIVWVSDDGVPCPTDSRVCGEYEALLEKSGDDYQFPDFDEDTIATRFYTTGTTGNPKGVYFSHRQLVLHSLSMMAALGSSPRGQNFHSGDVYMPITPMFHVHAWGIPYVALLLGVKQVYPGRYIPSRLLNLIKKEGVTFSHCVPTILQMLLNECDEKDSLTGWKVIIGGSALSEGLAREALSKGVDVFGGYGMSETCPLLTLSQLRSSLGELTLDEEVQYRCKAGVPAPLVDMRTVDTSMNDVVGEVSGEVVVRTPWLTQGYMGNEQASEALWSGGYLHTQDIGVLSRGYLKITDRLKDVIKTGGEWVSSLEIEDLLSTHASVAEAAVIGLPDEKWGERPLALVVARGSSVASEEELKRHLAIYVENGQISRYAIPDKILFVELIEKTSVGKIDKKLLRAKYGS